MVWIRYVDVVGGYGEERGDKERRGRVLVRKDQIATRAIKKRRRPGGREGMSHRYSESRLSESREGEGPRRFGGLDGWVVKVKSSVGGNRPRSIY